MSRNEPQHKETMTTNNDKCPECGAATMHKVAVGHDSLCRYECTSLWQTRKPFEQSVQCQLNVANQQITTLQASLTAAVADKEQAERERESIVASLQPLQYNGTLAEKVHNVVEELRAWSSREFETQLRAESAEAERDELRGKLEAIEAIAVERANPQWNSHFRILAEQILAILNPPPPGEVAGL